MRIDDPELDARHAAMYDADNGWRADDEFFLRVATRNPNARIVDVGCGTGRLTNALALAGHTVMGVDPNPAFLNIARTKPGADRVTWMRGTATDLASQTFDVALMTSHVAQEILTDDEWTELLAHLQRALRPGGTLCFDTRDPDARAWEDWVSTHAGTRRDVLIDGTVVDLRVEMTFANDVASFDHAAVESDGSAFFDPTSFSLTPGTTWSRATYGYRFRSAELVRSSLERAGFFVDHLYGGWNEEPLGDGAGEIVVVATV
jgi:SAM-dependent methyltransferase